MFLETISMKALCACFARVLPAVMVTCLRSPSRSLDVGEEGSGEGQRQRQRGGPGGSLARPDSLG
jgi:hypothetical protein